MKKKFIVFGGFSGATAVALGALGAHYLKSQLVTGTVTETNLQTFETAVKYQMYHAIMLIILAALFHKFEEGLLIKAANCFMIGTVLFSGSLYLLSTAGLLGLSNTLWLGPITPVGGLFLIAGWVLVGAGGLKINKANKN
jgi:uncharacterized membrane protein YgdD (TMEM256/DUF423 family)